MKRILRVPIIALASAALLWAAALSGPPAYAEPTATDLLGVTRSPDGVPVPGAQVVVYGMDGSPDRAVVSDAHGSFEIQGIRPGRYMIVGKKDGFRASPAMTVSIATGQALKIDVPLGLNAAGTEATQPAATTTPTTTVPSSNTAAKSPAEPSAMEKELDELKARIAELEAEMKGDQPAQPPMQPAADAESSSSSADSQPATTAAATASANPGTESSSTPQAAAEKPKDVDPFSLYDYTWMNGNSRNTDTPLATKYFSPEFRADTNYTIDANHPQDHTLGGSTETFESGEVQVEQLSFGGDLRVGNVRGRVLTMFGQWATTTPRNDVSPVTSSWNLDQAYRYVSEAWGGYHFNINHHGGLNVDAGIFVSYIGLFSYYNFDNWAYQPSYVSSNTPWFFNGLRVQYYPSAKLKIEPWFINGWQSYAKSNGDPGLGGQILWRPNGWLSLVSNNYGFGHDSPNILIQPQNETSAGVLGTTTGISRIHTDNSVEMKLYDRPGNLGFDKFAISVTGDLGCESGGTGNEQVSCFGKNGVPKEQFLGFMEYNRWWFHKDLYAITLGGGQMSNPGRYLTLLQPINGATAISGSPYFTENPGQPAKMWDTTLTFDYMPAQFLTFRFEGGYRHSDVPYWTGPGGITPPGGDNGSPADYVCANGASSGIVSSGSITADLPAVEGVCGGITGLTGKASVWFPDLREGQLVGTFAIMVKF